MKLKANKFTVYLVIAIIVSTGFYTGSIVLGSVHEKLTITANHGDTVQGEFKARFGSGMDNHIVVKFFITVGSIQYFVFSEDLWSWPAEAKEGNSVDSLTAGNPADNNVTLVFDEAGSYVIWIDSPYIEMTMEVTIINEMIALGLAISGLVTISLIALWLIKREQLKA